MIIDRTTPIIELDTGIDLEDATEVKILYQDPSGTKGSLVGAKDGQKISAKLPLAANTMSGEVSSIHGRWEFQSYAKFGDDIYKGQIVKKRFGRSLEP